MMYAIDIATRLGLQRYPRSWRGRCPCCDYHGATFSVRAARDGRARFFCSNGCGRDELANSVAHVTGQPPHKPEIEAHADAIRGRKRDRALALWRGSELAAGT